MAMAQSTRRVSRVVGAFKKAEAKRWALNRYSIMKCEDRNKMAMALTATPTRPEPP
jgi:hypothetical protein